MEDRLYKFAHLVDAGSYTKAAELMHISQPALTAAVKKLERELQAELLIRGNRTFCLTEAGHLAYQTAKDMSVQASNLRTQLAGASKSKPTLRLGLIDGMADLLFVHGQSLPHLEQSARLALTVDNSDRLVQLVERDTLDLALAAKPNSLPRALQAVELGEEPLVVVTHSSRTAIARAQLSQGELRDFLAYNRTSHTHGLISMFLQGAKITPEYTFYSTSPGIMLELILAGKGTAALPYLLIEEHLANGTLARLQTPAGSIIPRSIIATFRKGKVLPNVATELLAAAQGQLSSMQARANKA